MVIIAMMASVPVTNGGMRVIVMLVAAFFGEMQARFSDVEMVVPMQCLPERRDRTKADNNQPATKFFHLELDHNSNSKKSSSGRQLQAACYAKNIHATLKHFNI